jgi:hypothetical protein
MVGAVRISHDVIRQFLTVRRHGSAAAFGRNLGCAQAHGELTMFSWLLADTHGPVSHQAMA